MTQTTIIVPGTTANIGVGFDCLGAALTIYNEFQFSLVEGDRAEELSRADEERDERRPDGLSERGCHTCAQRRRERIMA